MPANFVCGASMALNSGDFGRLPPNGMPRYKAHREVVSNLIAWSRFSATSIQVEQVQESSDPAQMLLCTMNRKIGILLLLTLPAHSAAS